MNCRAQAQLLRLRESESRFLFPALLLLLLLLRADSFPQRRHFHRRQRRLKSLVPHLQSCPINRLLQVLAGQHAERMRHSRLLRRLPDPPRDFVDDHVIVRRISTQQTSQANDRVIFLSQSQRPSRQRNLKSPRHAHHVNVLFSRSRLQQAVTSARQKPVRDERVKARHHDGKALPRAPKLALDGRNRRIANSLNSNLPFRNSSPHLCPLWLKPLTCSIRVNPCKSAAKEFTSP